MFAADARMTAKERELEFFSARGRLVFAAAASCSRVDVQHTGLMA
jgi:hypothetical protein